MSLISKRAARLAVATSIACIAIPAGGITSASASTSATFVNGGLSVGGFPLRSSSTKKGLPNGKKKPPVIAGGVFAFPLRSS